MAEWENESSCSCDCGFDIPQGGELDHLTLKTPLPVTSGGTGQSSIDGIRDALGVLRIQAGSVAAMGNTASEQYKDGTVTFDSSFENSPVVVIGFDSQSVAGTFGRCAVSVVETSATGFKFRFFNGDASNRNPGFKWIAAGI